MATALGFNLKLAENVVVVFDVSLLPKRATTRQQRQAKHPFRGIAELGDGVDVVAASGPGAPVAAVTMEFLAALGARRVVSVGVAGALDSNIEVGTPFAVAKAVSDEGTSRHYIALDGPVAADPSMTKGLVGLTGRPSRVSLSTDVPFRHTPERLVAHRSQASLVDMESSALFAAAHAFDIEPAALLVASDVFDGPTWRAADAARTAAGVREALGIATDLLARLV